MSIGNKIKEYRELNKMTQKDIAEILKVESGTISKYESGIIEPNIESLKRLAETFNITVDELIKDIIEFHARFEKIHPFQDGNGRVGRMIAFKEC